MSKVNLPAIPGGYLSLGAMNTRFAAIEDAFDNTLSLDGSLPNSMEADLDMDGNDLLNTNNIFASTLNADTAAFNNLSVGGTQFVSIDSFMQDDRHTVFVGEFGAVGNGVTDDTVAVQEAIEYAAERLLTLVFDGTYLVGELDYPDHIDWLGKNGATLLYSAPGADPLRSWIQPDTVAAHNTAEGKYYGGRVVGLTFDYQSTAYGRHMFEMTNPYGWHFENCTFLNQKQRAALAGNISCELEVNFPAVLPMGDIVVRNCVFSGTGDGGGVGIFAYPSVRVGPVLIENISITDNYFYVGRNMCFVGVAGAGSSDYNGEVNALEYFRAFKDFVFSRNRMVGNGEGPDGAIPTEFWGHTNVVVTDNIIDQATRGIGLAGVKDVTCSGNVIKNQTAYASEVGGPIVPTQGFTAPTENFTWSHNVCIDCEKMLSIGASVLKDAVISSNIHRGTGRSTHKANTHSIQVQRVSAGTTPQQEAIYAERKNVTIMGNEFIDLEYITGAIRMYGVSNYSIKNNTLRASTIPSAVNLCVVSQPYDEYVSVVGNTIVVTANRDAASTQTGVMVLVSRPASHVMVTGNNFICDVADATIGAATDNRLNGIGEVAGAGLMDNCVVANNNFTGTIWQCFQINSTSATTVVGPNNRDGVVEQSTETEFNRRPIATYSKWKTERNLGDAPTTGYWHRGDVIKHWNPSTGQPIGWVCTVSGTPGTWVAMANL